jgi:hypothetical protein
MPRPILLTYGEETHSLRDWSRRRGIGQSTLGARRQRGWTDAEVLGFVPHRKGCHTPLVATPSPRRPQPWCPHHTHGIEVSLHSLQIAQAYARVFGCTSVLALVYHPCARCEEEDL